MRNDDLHPDNLPDSAWTSRGYLPHIDESRLTQAVTFRLADSLPRKVLDWARAEADPGKKRQLLDEGLDRGRGSCLLANEYAAVAVEEALFADDGGAYRLVAWVVMPNHVHVLARMTAGESLGRIVRSWKGRSAREINRRAERSGRLWYPDYYDRFVRSSEHFDRLVGYIENNPVKAGLVRRPTQWPYSSARRRRKLVAR